MAAIVLNDEEADDEDRRRDGEEKGRPKPSRKSPKKCRRSDRERHCGRRQLACRVGSIRYGKRRKPPAPGCRGGIAETMRGRQLNRLRHRVVAVSTYCRCRPGTK